MDNNANQPLISVIVPVYNVKEYLERCALSILNQTYKNIEVILVDDGSADGSGELAEEIAKRDSRIKVIRKANGGVSSARNAGLDAATGEYIGFVDGDDYVDKEMYGFLLGLITENNAQIACCGFKKDSGNQPEDVKERPAAEISLSIYGKIEAQRLLAEEKVFAVSVCDKLFARKITDKVRFNTDISFGEDFLFCFAAFDNCVKVVLSDRKYYHYYIREGSCVNSEFGEKQFDRLKVSEEIENNFRVEDNVLEGLLKDRKIRSQIFLLRAIAVSGKFKNKYKSVRKSLLANKKYIFFGKNSLKFRHSFAVFVIWLFNPLFILAAKIAKKKK